MRIETSLRNLSSFSVFVFIWCVYLILFGVFFKFISEVFFFLNFLFICVFVILFGMFM